LAEISKISGNFDFKSQFHFPPEFVGTFANDFESFNEWFNFSSSTFNFKPETLNSELSNRKTTTCACSIFQMFFDTNTFYHIFRFSNSCGIDESKPIPPMTNSSSMVSRVVPAISKRWHVLH
jgi:hypothetical protein